MSAQLLHSNVITNPSATKNLLILHGFLGMSDNWRTLGNQYAQQGFNVHILDLRNHGKSFHSNEFSYEIMASDVLDYCEAHAIEKFSLLGHSMGGKVAMQVAVSQPNTIEKLIIADISPKYYAPHHQDILHALKSVDFTKKPSRQEVEEIISKDITDQGTKQFLLKNLYWETPDQLAFRFNLKVLDEKIEEIGKALQDNLVFNNPAFFILGVTSPYVKDADFELINKHFTNATFFTIPNVGHWLHAENPVLFFEKTLDFLK
jgi:esterase